MDFQQIQRHIRRIKEVPWNYNFNRRIAIIVTVIIIFIFYYFILSDSRTPPTQLQVCVIDHFKDQYGKNINFESANQSLSFVGNGYIGLDVSNYGELILQSNSTVFNILRGFSPLVSLSIDYVDEYALHFASDPTDGMSKAVRCSIISDTCVCVYENVYAHRSRPNILIQDIKLSNPSINPLNIKFHRTISSDWEKQNISNIASYYHVFKFQGVETAVGIACSLVPAALVVNQKREESFRFICAIEYSTIGSDTILAKRQVIAKAIEKFSDVNAMYHSKLDAEHKDAWEILNVARLNISSSKAPNALNTELIDLTRYLLLSSVRDPIIELNSNSKSIEFSKTSLEKNELCYKGHTTMLTPSKLWQYWKNLNDIQATINIWMLTLKHHGCMHLVEAGAHGVAQAFLLSLTAATYTHHHLEFALDPTDDLHRPIHIEGLMYLPGVSISVDFDMDSEYRPLIRIKSSEKGMTMYACTGGCYDGPRELSNSIIEFPIKVTKPASPILFVSNNKFVLSSLKETLHVIDVSDAPKHLPEKIALHKHGEDGGLPTLFWVILVCLLVSFHVFLIKLLYSEWKNSSSVPYSKFSKKVLLRR